MESISQLSGLVDPLGLTSKVTGKLCFRAAGTFGDFAVTLYLAVAALGTGRIFGRAAIFDSLGRAGAGFRGLLHGTLGMRRTTS